MSSPPRTLQSRLTPYVDDDAACERVDVQLRIYAHDLDPMVVSGLLQLEPTSSQKRGQESRPNQLGRTRTAPIGAWFLSSEGRVPSKDLRRHLDWLLHQLTPRAAALHQLQATEGVRMTVSCIWWSASGQGGPTVWPEQMKALADLDLECALSVSYYGDDEDRPVRE
jgi:hypothetical protein